MHRRLDQALVERGLVRSRQQASGLIMSGRVKINDKLASKVGQRVGDKDHLSITPGPRYVSRAALKLESVTGLLKLHFKNKIILDVGASTGGFSDFAIQNGAAKIYAVDVGTNQLVTSLRNHPKIISMERTDIRDVKQLPDMIDLVLVDVSFISVRLILPGLITLLKPSGQLLVMVKPQFEAGRANLNKGIVKNDTIRRRILSDFEEWATNYFKIWGKADSGVAGLKGNRERFYLLSPIKR